MGLNPSSCKPGSKTYAADYSVAYSLTKGEDANKLPVDSVSWYDAIYFCNKLSVMKGLTPVYEVYGSSDVEDWDYTPNEGYDDYCDSLDESDITMDDSADGYRLQTIEEWLYAAEGGKSFDYAESNKIDEVAWWKGNSSNKSHQVGKKQG